MTVSTVSVPTTSIAHPRFTVSAARLIPKPADALTCLTVCNPSIAFYSSHYAASFAFCQLGPVPKVAGI